MRSVSSLAAMATFLLAGAGCAQGPGMMGGGPGRGPHVGPDHTPGWAMMNQAERDEHHKRMQGIRTPEECRQAMEEQRRRMQERATARGLMMPGPNQDACAGMMRR